MDKGVTTCPPLEGCKNVDPASIFALFLDFEKGKPPIL